MKHLRPGMGEGVDALPKHLRPRSGYSGAYARLIPDEPARTITRWVFHPGLVASIIPTIPCNYDSEAARLQSFPDWFAFEGTYIQKSHQVGEAVSVTRAGFCCGDSEDVNGLGLRVLSPLNPSMTLYTNQSGICKPLLVFGKLQRVASARDTT